jgi:hypothetical protein
MYFDHPEDECFDIEPGSIDTEVEMLVLMLPKVKLLMQLAMMSNNE